MSNYNYHLNYSNYMDTPQTLLENSRTFVSNSNKNIMDIFKERLNELKQSMCVREKRDTEISPTELDEENVVVLEKILAIKDKINHKKSFVKMLEEKHAALNIENAKVENSQNILMQFMDMYKSMSFGENKMNETQMEHLKVLTAISGNITHKICVNKEKMNALGNQLEETLRDIKMLKQILYVCEGEKSPENGVDILCSICDENKIQYTLNPCGHTFCDKCAARLQTSCFTCRNVFQNKIKMYYD